MLADARSTRFLAVVLTVVVLVLSVPGLVERLSGLEGRPGSRLSALQLGQLLPGALTPPFDESSPAESEGQRSDSEDAPSDSDGPLEKVEHLAQRRGACRVRLAARHRAHHPELSDAVGISGPRSSIVISSAKPGARLPVLLCRLTC